MWHLWSIKRLKQSNYVFFLGGGGIPRLIHWRSLVSLIEWGFCHIVKRHAIGGKLWWWYHNSHLGLRQLTIDSNRKEAVGLINEQWALVVWPFNTGCGFLIYTSKTSSSGRDQFSRQYTPWALKSSGTGKLNELIQWILWNMKLKCYSAATYRGRREPPV